MKKSKLQQTYTTNGVLATVKFAIENDFVNGEVININGGLTI